VHHDLSKRERQIMEVIYRRGKASVREVLDDIPNPPSYSAVRAMMNILENKGFITHVKVGRKYVYASTTPIKKVYPQAPKPPVLQADSIRILFPNGADTLYLTEDGFIKFYEYEYTFEGLLPTVPYWINVTAFDYGSPKSGLAALETSPTLLPVVNYALPSSTAIDEEGLEVFVYPNPYREDEAYRARGFEDRARSGLPDDRTRLVHFANLPPKCIIRIYSLDGDLVREISHDFDLADPLSNHDTWDLITRNSQQAVSGLYYWTVEDDTGNTQIGRFALIM